MSYDQLIRAQAKAAETACGRISPPRIEALRESLREACQLPAGTAWELRAAAHAAFFTALAEAAGDPVAALVLLSGSDLAYELMVTAGRGASGIITNSRCRFLERLRKGDAEGAALEMEEHLRILDVMCRLAAPGRPRGPRRVPPRRQIA
jgi:DNA-binding GntR family transcriptional regulator